MTTQTHRKTIAAAAVIGALAIAAPASASVLEPVSTAHYSTSADQGQAAQVQTINATYQPPQQQQRSAQVQTINATYQPEPPALIAATNEHPFSGQGGTQLPNDTQVALRRDGSKAEPFAASAEPIVASADSTQVVLRRDGSKAEPFAISETEPYVLSKAEPYAPTDTTVASSGSGFDWGDAAIGAGVSLLAAALLMMGSGGLGGRRTSSRPSTGGAVSQGA